MSPETTQYRVTLDNLNHYMSRNDLPPELQQRLRDYFMRTQNLLIGQSDLNLVRRMPISLQGELLEQVHYAWLIKVPFLCRNEVRTPAMIAELVLRMEAAIFPPGDSTPKSRLYVIRKGVAVFGGVNMFAGSVWGEDCVLSAEYLRSRNSARAAAYLETSYMHRDTLLDIIGRHPVAQVGNPSCHPSNPPSRRPSILGPASIPG